MAGFFASQRSRCSTASRSSVPKMICSFKVISLEWPRRTRRKDLAYSAKGCPQKFASTVTGFAPITDWGRLPPERAGVFRAEDRSAPKDGNRVHGAVQPITKSATPPPADEGSDEAAQAGDDLAQGDANPHGKCWLWPACSAIDEKRLRTAG
jgi:hypothetical protein